MILPYERPALNYPKQERFINDVARHCYVEAGTKAGKTIGMIIWIHEQCIWGKRHENYWWVAPSAGTAKIAFDRLYNKHIPTSQKKFYKRNETERSITYPNGTKLWFKGADVPDSLYGEDVFGVVIDEASRVKENSYIAILSTTTATNAAVRYIGNLKGKKNWFYRECQKAKSLLDPVRAAQTGFYGYHKLTSYDNPSLDRAQIENMRTKMSSEAFAELYLAEAREDGSNPFGDANIENCVDEQATNLNGWIHPGAEVVAYGVDVGSVIDYTVIIGLDDKGRVVYIERFKEDWGVVKARIIATVGGSFCLIDNTGIGNNVHEEIKATYQCPNLQGFTYSARSKKFSKQDLMQLLAMGMAEGKVSYPRDSVLHNELKTFEYKETHWGVTYNAPQGLHDDCVNALALAYKKLRDMGYFA